MDQALEAARGKGMIGTTGRGIGPTYEDKVARRGIRLCDLADTELLSEKVEQLLVHHNACQRSGCRRDGCPVANRIDRDCPAILPYAAPVWRVLDEGLAAPIKNIV